MLCFCCGNQDEYVLEWEVKISNIIKDLQKVKKLGRRFVEDKIFDRRDSQEEKKIVEYIKKVDDNLLEAKLMAIKYLFANASLRDECNEQIEFYKLYARKEIEILELKKEKSRLENNYKRLEFQNGKLKKQLESTSLQCEELDEVLVRAEQRYELMSEKSEERLISELKKLISDYEEKQTILNSQFNLQKVSHSSDLVDLEDLEDRNSEPKTQAATHSSMKTAISNSQFQHKCKWGCSRGYKKNDGEETEMSLLTNTDERNASQELQQNEPAEVTKPPGESEC